MSMVYLSIMHIITANVHGYAWQYYEYASHDSIKDSIRNFNIFLETIRGSTRKKQVRITCFFFIIKKSLFRELLK